MELSGLATIYGNGSTKEILPKEITSHTLRRGKWTVEEERYTEKIIMDFENGTLDVPEGTTLRTYLSKVLNCDPMRITKKYTGNSSIGKRTFTPLVRSPENIPFIELSQRELEDLRRSWISKLLLAEQWNHRKLSLMKNGKPFFSKSDDNSLPSHHDHHTAHSPGLAGHQDEVESNHEGSDQSDDGGNVSTSGTNMKLREDTISNALKAYLTDPARVSYVVNWLKASCNALSQPGTSQEELNHLIQIGEVTIPALEQLLKRAGVTTAESLHKVLSNYSEGEGEEEDDGEGEAETAEGSNKEMKTTKSSNKPPDSNGNNSSSSKEKENNSRSSKDEDARLKAATTISTTGNGSTAFPNTLFPELLPQSMLANPNLYAYYYNQYAAAYSAAAVNGSHSLGLDASSDKKSRRKRERDLASSTGLPPGFTVPPTATTTTATTAGFAYSADNSYSMYYPNYLYGAAAATAATATSPSYADYLTHPSAAAAAAAMRMPSYQDYLNALYLQQKGLLPPNPMMSSHLPESMYDPMYLRQMNQWMASTGRSRQSNNNTTAEEMEAYQAAFQQAQVNAAKALAGNSSSSKSSLPQATTNSTTSSSTKIDAKSPATVVTPTAMIEKASTDTKDDITATLLPPMKKQKSSDEIILGEAIKSPTTKKVRQSNSNNTTTAAQGSNKKPKSPKEKDTTSSKSSSTPTIEAVEAAEGTSVEFAAEALLGLLGR